MSVTPYKFIFHSFPTEFPIQTNSHRAAAAPSCWEQAQRSHSSSFSWAQPRSNPPLSHQPSARTWGFLQNVAAVPALQVLLPQEGQAQPGVTPSWNCTLGCTLGMNFHGHQGLTNPHGCRGGYKPFKPFPSCSGQAHSPGNSWELPHSTSFLDTNSACSQIRELITAAREPEMILTENHRNHRV